MAEACFPQLSSPDHTKWALGEAVSASIVFSALAGESAEGQAGASEEDKQAGDNSVPWTQ